MGIQLPSPKRGWSPQFLAHICYGQMAGWIKMPLGMEVGLTPGDFVLDRDPAPTPLKGHSPCPIFSPCLLWPNGWIDKLALGMDVGLGPGHIVLDGDLAPFPQRSGQSPEFSAHVYCGQTAGWIKMALGMEMGFSAGHIVHNGDPASPPEKGHSPPPYFRPMPIVAKRLDGSKCHLVWR